MSHKNHVLLEIGDCVQDQSGLPKSWDLEEQTLVLEC